MSQPATAALDEPCLLPAANLSAFIEKVTQAKAEYLSGKNEGVKNLCQSTTKPRKRKSASKSTSPLPAS